MYNELGIIGKALFCIIRSSALTFKMSKMVLNPFCDETLHISFREKKRVLVFFLINVKM